MLRANELRGRLTSKAVEKCAEGLLGVRILDSSNCRLVLRVLLDSLDLLVLLVVWKMISDCSRVRGGSNIPSTLVVLRFGVLRFGALRGAMAAARRIEG